MPRELCIVALGAPYIYLHNFHRSPRERRRNVEVSRAVDRPVVDRVPRRAALPTDSASCPVDLTESRSRAGRARSPCCQTGDKAPPQANVTYRWRLHEVEHRRRREAVQLELAAIPDYPAELYRGPTRLIINW